MAALSVVYRRLQEVNLAEYCLSLHNYKAEKKQVIQDLVGTLDAPKKKLKVGASDFLSKLEEERELLNVYFRELDKKREPLNLTLYEVITELIALENIPFYRINEDVTSVKEQDYKYRLSILKRYRKFIEHYNGSIIENPWKNTNISMITFDLEDRLSNTLNELSAILFGISTMLDCVNNKYNIEIKWTWNSFVRFIDQLNGYRMFVEAYSGIRKFYDDKISESAQIDHIDELIESYKKIKRNLISQHITTDIVDTEEAREKLSVQIAKQEKELLELKNWIIEFNHNFSTSFEISQKGVESLTEYAKLLLSCDIFEKNWADPVNYIAAGDLILEGDHLVRDIINCRISQYDFLFDNVLVIQKREYNLKELPETADYYLSHSERASALAKSLSDAVKETIESGITIECICNAWFRKAELRSRQDKKEKVEIAEKFLYNCKSKLDANVTLDQNGLSKMEELFQILTGEYCILREWIVEDNYNVLIQKLMKLKEVASKVLEIESALNVEWSSDIYSLDCSGMLGRFRSDYTSFFKRLGGQYKQDKRTLMAAKKSLIGKLEDSPCVQMLEQLQAYKDMLFTFDEMREEAIHLFGKYFKGLTTDWRTIENCLISAKSANEYYHKYDMSEDLISLCCEPVHVRKNYHIGDISLDQVMQQDLITAYRRNTEFCEKYNFTDVRKQLERQIAALIPVIDLCGQADKFIFEDTELSIIGKIEMTVRDNINITNYYSYLERFCRTSEKIKQFYDRVGVFQSAIPSKFNGFFTDWSELENDWKQCKVFHEYLLNHTVSDYVINSMASKRSARTNISIQGIKLGDVAAGTVQNKYEMLLHLYPDEVKESEKKLCILKETNIEAGILANDIRNTLRNLNCDFSLEQSLLFLEKYNYMMKLCKQLQANYEVILKEYCVPYADERETESIFELLEEYINIEIITNEVADYMKGYGVISGEEAGKWLRVLCETIHPIQTAQCFDTFKGWFINEQFSDVDIHVLIDRVEGCKCMEALSNWLDYCDIEKLFHEAGILDYLLYLQEYKIEASKIIPIYKKGFLVKWYYDTIEKYELNYIQKFQAYSHENTIQDFMIQDVKQMKLAQARLDEILSCKKPSGNNVMSNAMDEISILRKEAGKRRNIMPLRKLFKVIPTLLQKLKPCFMMSPLSVSYFLDSDMYEFDMVIFDEASQILPEDAIGSIYRGRQVIISGDTKQMPPTSFFSVASKNIEDYDIDDEEDDNYVDIVSESILDEANTCLPSCMLSWHYRSKDESLIAFSNREIYRNKLITFPNCKKEADRGLEYIYVPNGYYEGKPKNCNIMEAKRCVQLVEEHIKNHPERSLGIIAFSEKQQNTIEDALNDWRLKNPSYEDFFEEDKEEPFFVKNLENVQGDERDTIIFSICYARNKQGKMYMRFGPLGLSGGERRLNVAITRAKYNVKLVGSIYPNDLNITETTALGVQLLAKYISFAMENDYEMPMGTSEMATDEHFVDIIADFIMENGYRIRRNVGSSQYKLDIAVIHPDSPNEFFAGIECDGSNYTIARTARDRDITRKNIMTMMGWDIYHVWSVAWYKNPKESKRKLLDFLKDASAKYLTSKSINHIKDRVSEIEMLEEHIDANTMTDVTDSTTEVHKLHFSRYQCCDPWKAQYVQGDDNYSNLARRIMYIMNHEAPIHKELLYKRLAVVFGRQKATTLVVRTVDDCIETRLSGKMVLRGDFWYLPNQTKGNIVARVPLSDEDKRPMEQICQEEIQDAIKKILCLAYGLTIDNLVSETARQFGFQRTGPKIRSVIESNYEFLLKEGIAKVSDGKIYLVEV